MGDIPSEIRVSDKFCAKCQTIFEKDLRSKERRIHYETVLELVASAKRGCLLCRRIVRGFSRHENNVANKEGHVYGYTSFVDFESNIATLSFWSGRHFDYKVDFDLHPIRTRALACQDLSRSTGSDETFETIKRWLEHCETSHSGCRTVGSRKWAPTRLLHLVSASKIKLVDTDGDSHVVYLSLSHCWGQYQPLRLLEENELILRKGISVAQLSPTFRDAFDATWRLGYRYLWIDSLCIKQDSEQDWQNESARMMDVYRFADLNLAAADANDGREGMYGSRSTGELAFLIVNVKPPYQTPLNCYIHSESDTEPEGPLISRGWVFQERLLPPRVVYFGKTQILWHCRQSSWSEALTTVELHEIINRPLEQSGQSLVQQIFESKSTVQNTSSRWIELCSQYSRLSLTQPWDKLIAISGIVGVFGQTRSDGDEYLAGLWRSELPRGLLWYCSKATVRPPVYQSPSWSWASLNTEVQWGTGSRTYPCLCVDSKIGLCESTAKFGQVTLGSSLTIRASIMSFEWSVPLEVNHNFGAQVRVSQLYLVNEGIRTGIPAWSCLQWDLIEDEMIFSANVALLGADILEDLTNIEGILLLPHGSDHYRRAGYINTIFRTKDHKRVAEFALDETNWQEIVLV